MGITFLRSCARALAALGHTLCLLLCLPLCLLIPGTAAAQMHALSDTELSTVSGQGMFTVSNSSYGGFDFTRIGLDADVTLNANLSNIRLGQYTYAQRNGTGADIDIGTLNFGTTSNRLVQITDPYFEFVYQTDPTSGQRQVVGMRMGFDGISGDIGTKIASLSGSILINGGAAGTVNSANDPGGGKRWDGTCATCTLSLSQIGGVAAGDASGPSRDFWISVLKTPVQFAPTAGMAAPAVAQAGVWLNWTDKLTALNTTGTVPSNLAPTLATNLAATLANLSTLATH